MFSMYEVCNTCNGACQKFKTLSSIHGDDNIVSMKYLWTHPPTWARPIARDNIMQARKDEGGQLDQLAPAVLLHFFSRIIFPSSCGTIACTYHVVHIGLHSGPYNSPLCYSCQVHSCMRPGWPASWISWVWIILISSLSSSSPFEKAEKHRS